MIISIVIISNNTNTTTIMGSTILCCQHIGDEDFNTKKVRT